jgi:hypothetical protein
VKRPLRPLVGHVRAFLRRRALRQGARDLRREVAAGAISRATLSRLREAWGNPGYSADLEFVAVVADAALTAGGPCLECGSGLTTLVAGIVTGERGLGLYTLEENERWLGEVADTLRDVGVHHVKGYHTPLRSYGEFAWYDLEEVALPPAFACVFCDGPAIWREAWPAEVHGNWRVGLVPVLAERGVQVGKILLDDADDGRSATLRRQWEQMGMRTEIVATETGPYLRAYRGAVPPSL